MTTVSRPPARLIWAASATCADLWQVAKLPTSDSFLWLEIGTHRWVVVSPLEVGRAVRLAPAGTKVLTREQAAVEFGVEPPERPTTTALVLGVARKFRRTCWEVPADFPLGLAQQLEAEGLRLRSVQPFLPERRCKTPAELAFLRAGVKLAEIGLARARAVLRSAQLVRGRCLSWNGTPLTAERLRAEIEIAILRRGGRCERTIVAPGRQGADPHEAGHGPIHADEPIVLDIFPRDERSGYFGDLTRTVVKGRAPEVVRRAHAAVRAAQLAAIAQARPGVKLATVHAAASAVLEQHGFVTDLTTVPPRGFIHGTGHGLGLEIHEAPRLGRIAGQLQAGDVVTIEPGLYYPEWGGVRLEDDLAITATGAELLSHASHALEIP